MDANRHKLDGWRHPCDSHRRMRTRIWFTIITVMILAVVPAASALPVALAVVPIAILEPGSLLLLGITLLTLAGVVQRVFFS